MKKIITLSLASLFVSSAPAFALEQIIKPYQSIRSSGMGGVKVTTGLYDENFHGNPARTIANPRFRVTILDPMVEVNSTSITNIPDILSAGDDALNQIAENAGENHHARVQLSLPSVYFPAKPAEEGKEAGKLAFAFGILTSIQLDGDIQRSGDPDIDVIADVGPNFSVAHKFLDDDALTAGLNARFQYRVASKQVFGLVDILRGTAYGASGGGKVDFDIGGLYKLPLEWEGATFEAGAVLSNVIGGDFTIAKMDNITETPPPAPRALGFGIAARKPKWWKFTDVTAALEFQDIGNNGGGSLFRTVHLGMEAHYGILAPRIGFNQGYISGGLAILSRFATFELATYGEEMRLNVGDQQDRRYALRIALQI